MTKAHVIECLNEIGHRFVRSHHETDPTRYKELGIAFGVAYFYVKELPTVEVERLAHVIEELALAGGSVE